ncbi:helicase associated domain-containing protein [Oceanospirillaceae bacterium]|nr:helicase associated domain-containing protein [Oceanospirillaceae bacterium]
MHSFLKLINAFEHLLAYKKEHGNCLVPFSFKYHDFNLGSWISLQRKEEAKLTSEQIKRLDELKFDWAPLEDRWEMAFEHLVAYKKKHGHCEVPKSFIQLGYKLGRLNDRRKRS